MGQSYRIRTELGVNKTINVELEQQFEFLEILSLTLQQEDIYTKSCSQYGVVVGRVTANNGFGIPNARVSIFIPIDFVDESNPIISSIYPYKSPSDKNEDGYRYNLLPYEKSYSVHAATGTLPSRLDVLTGDTAVQIYDKYYKYTVKTNESGDYMIMGVPQGNHTLVMDVDLSDIGEFSLTPQDLIRMGLASESQVAGNRFRSSNDLNSLPQIINIVKNVEVSPLWGDPELCDIAINRVDFDLRDDANVDIQPTATFMGSIFSNNDDMRVRFGESIDDDAGNLCGLIAGPGRILAIRQTVYQDEEGNPVLEQYQLEQSGNIIDENGVWLTELPMNLDYYITNEFGEKVLSNDPTIGIPTKGNYRFKIKWEQSTGLSEQVKRPHFIVPNIREYGWTNSNSDPYTNPNAPLNDKKKLASSYYFGLSWSGYTDGFGTGAEKFDRLQEIIDCEDTFYQFGYNKVYTVSQLIDQYKIGGRGQFIGIKEIDSNACSSTINKFPVNEGFRNFDFLFFLFSFILQIIQLIMVPIILIIRIVLFLFWLITRVFCAICAIGISVGFVSIYPFRWLCTTFGIPCNGFNTDISLGMLTYPSCQSCSCETTVTPMAPDDSENPNVTTASGFLSYLSYPPYFLGAWENVVTTNNPNYNSESIDNYTLILSQATSGFERNRNDDTKYKLPIAFDYKRVDVEWLTTFSLNLPLGERVNIFNQRQSFFSNYNKIKVTFAKDNNIGKFHNDNTITVLANTNQTYNAGDLLTFVSQSKTQDKNYLYSATTASGGEVFGISGISAYPSSIVVNYANTQNTTSSETYLLPPISTIPNYSGITRNIYPADIEYYQVLTAITISQAKTIWTTGTTHSFPNIINEPSTINVAKQTGVNVFGAPVWGPYSTITINPIEYYDSYEDQVILILQRGVDPYSPKLNNEYDVSLIFGQPFGTLVFTASTRFNIPIQPISSSSSISVQSYPSQDNIFYSSQFFTPGIPSTTLPGLQFTAYTTSATTYYGFQDATNRDAATTTSSVGSGSNKRVVTLTNNLFYSSTPNSSKYDSAEDVSGMGYMWLRNGGIPAFFNGDRRYYTKSIPVSQKTTMSNRLKNVLRTDRLPTSDKLDGFKWDYNPSILQQNINFGIYFVPGQGTTYNSQSYSTGASIPTPNLKGLPAGTNVLESFNCPGMVPLDCYTGFGDKFETIRPCNDPQGTGYNYVENGCYILLRSPQNLVGFIDDWKIWAEWGSRYRFMYALCRGVLSQTFTNNWINGSLYMFPIQNDTSFNDSNVPSYPIIPYEMVYYDINTFNFYYRCSPYNNITNDFIGRPPGGNDPVNDRNLMFPTTIINLGYKDSFYSEVTFEPETNAYVIPELNPTSYGDTSDLVNLFVVSRMVDSSFLGGILSFLNDSIGLLFTRGEGSGLLNTGIFKNLAKSRVDADFAQLCSINSEIGNVNFSPQYYSGPSTTILGSPGNPTMAVWFSSTTQNLQTKDYLSPGRINFTSIDGQQNFPYPYGIKSQIVPQYQWQLKENTNNTIFGSQYNNWATTQADIVQNKRYQSLDRISQVSPTYFVTKSNVNDTYKRGYIFSVEVNGVYSSKLLTSSSKFIVGAPFHFYFGTIKGATALELFKRKYSVSE